MASGIIRSVIVFVVTLLISAQVSVAVTGWTYAATASTCAGTTASPCGPEHWNKVSATCDVDEYPIQSPINLAYNEVVFSDSVDFPAFKASGGGCKDWTQFTNQYVFEVSFQDSGCSNLTATYNGEEYWLNQIHIHSGSEHMLGGGQYSAEIHLVHYNSPAGSSSATAAFVVGIFLEASPLVPVTNNTFFHNFFAPDGYYPSVVETEQEMVDRDPVDPYSTLFPPRPGVYSYIGSLTTPPCTTGVQWFVFDQPVQISPEDLHVLRQSVAEHSGNLLAASGNNNRGYTIPLGSRTLHYSTQSMSVETDAPTNAPTFSPTHDDHDGKAALVLGAIGTSLSGVALIAILLIVIFNKNSAPAENRYTGVEMTATDSKL